eukprot:Pompholyxophrys_punicea_v1_NODE_664_length_1495_cov_2.685417.p2 type:complete len:103 gc:universal NODE_664_length_1495_cov_2.685417:367-675(+)
MLTLFAKEVGCSKDQLQQEYGEAVSQKNWKNFPDCSIVSHDLPNFFSGTSEYCKQLVYPMTKPLKQLVVKDRLDIDEPLEITDLCPYIFQTISTRYFTVILW